jgi:hypothetical protein
VVAAPSASKVAVGRLERAGGGTSCGGGAPADVDARRSFTTGVKARRSSARAWRCGMSGAARPARPRGREGRGARILGPSDQICALHRCQPRQRLAAAGHGGAVHAAAASSGMPGRRPRAEVVLPVGPVEHGEFLSMAVAFGGGSGGGFSSVANLPA